MNFVKDIFKTNALNLLLGRLQISISLGSVMKNYCVPLLVPCFMEFLYSVKSHIAVLHLKPSSFPGFRRDTTSGSPARDFSVNENFISSYSKCFFNGYQVLESTCRKHVENFV